MIPFEFAFKEIRRRKFRTAVNVAGFVIAVSCLVTLVMAARGWETCTAAPLNSIGTDMVFIYNAPVAPSNTGCYIVNHLFSYPFNQSLLDDIVENVPDVECAVPVLMHRLRAMVFTGFDPSFTETNAIYETDVVEGRFLTSDDEYVALVDKEYAELNNLTLGSTVNYAADFQVVGIVDVSTTNIMKSHIYVNLPVVQQVLPEKPIGLVNMGLIQTTSPDKVSQTAAALEHIWPDSSTLTGLDLAEKAEGIIQITENTARSISVALIVVAAFLVAKSQIGNVGERTREIGILKAIGWSNKNIVNQIVVESTLQGVLGGLVGIGLGTVFSLIVLSTIGGGLGSALKFVSIDPVLLGIGFAVATMSAIVAGLIASFRAARLVPVEALRAT